MHRLLFILIFLPSSLAFGQVQSLPVELDVADSIWNQYPDSALSITEKIIQREADAYVKGRAWFRQGRILLNKKQAHEQAEAAFLQAVDLLNDNFEGRAYRNLGRISSHLGRYDEALERYDKALEVCKREKYTEGLADTYNSKGNLLKDIGEYHEAILHFYQGLDLFEKLDIHLGQARVYNNLGNCYVELDSIGRGLTYYRKAMNMLEDYPGMQSVVRMNVARYADPAESIPEYHKLIAYHQTRKRRDQEAIVTVNLGHAYRADDQSEKAKAAYERSLELAASINDMRLIISNNAQLANIAGQEKDYDASIRFAQRAFEMSIPNFPKDSLEFNPPVSLISLKLESLHILQDKGLSYLWRYRIQSHDTTDLHTAIATLERAIEVLHSLYASTQNIQAKLSFKDQFHLLFDITLSAYWDLWEENQDQTVIAQAFRVMEYAKASFLADQMFEDRQKAGSKLPADWQEREQSLQLRLVNKEKEILRAQNEGRYGELGSLQASRFRLLQRIRRLQESLRQTNPDFYRIQQLSTPVTMDSLKRYALKSVEQSMISYFLGNTWLYVIQVRKDSSLFLRKTIPDQLDEKIKRLRDGIFGFWTLKTGCESGSLKGEFCDSLMILKEKYARQYQQEAHSLYVWLLGEWENTLTPKLTISPDGLLSFLPFEALLTDSTGMSGWQNQAYMIRKYQLSYAYSATVLFHQLNRISPTKPAKLLAIAPFSGKSNTQKSMQTSGSASDQIAQLRSGHWGKLAYSGIEVEQIHDIWGGEMLLDEQAAKAQFLQTAPKYNVLHLATHAKAHDYEPLLSLLAFADTFAPLPELANEHLPAELVVLSACESGLGQLQDGEGVISLARAFTQAGARAMVTTLWSVEDRATAQIMAGFYRYLSEGLAKDAALRQARLDYVDSAEPEFAHPFFWAGLTASGKMEALQKKDEAPFPKWQLTLGLIFLLILGGLGFKNYMKR